MRAERHFRPLTLEAATLLTEGRYKEAVRAVRDAEQVSTRVARKRVEDHLDREPLLRAQLDAQRRAARGRFFFWLLLVDAVIIAAIVYWFFYRGSA